MNINCMQEEGSSVLFRWYIVHFTATAIVGFSLKNKLSTLAKSIRQEGKSVLRMADRAWNWHITNTSRQNPWLKMTRNHRTGCSSHKFPPPPLWTLVLYGDSSHPGHLDDEPTVPLLHVVLGPNVPLRTRCPPICLGLSIHIHGFCGVLSWMAHVNGTCWFWKLAIAPPAM